MEKSLEQLKHIERISRQTRHHRTYLNQICDQNLCKELNHLAKKREQSILRSTSRRQLEEERKQFLNITIKQIITERQHEPLPLNITQFEQESNQTLSKYDESRPSSSVELPSYETSCHLFSHNCQLYPCQPIYQYTSIIKKEHDQILRKRNSSTNSPTKSFNKLYLRNSPTNSSAESSNKLYLRNSPTNSSTESSNKLYLRDLFTTIQGKKHQQNRRQLASAINNQYHQANRHVSMQRTMARLDEQSRLLHERLAEKKTFGYVKEHQYRLSQAIQRHLKVTAKFCA